MLENIKALIFDMDGTMIANKIYHDDAWIAFCKKYRQNANIDDFIHRYAGKTNEVILEMVFDRQLTIEEFRKFEDIKESMYREMYTPHFKLVSGLVDLLELAKLKGLKLAIATSAPQVNVDFVCNNGNIGKYFDTTINSTMVTEGKPSPEVFLKAPKALNVQPAECICFEDSRVGITASLAAGMRTVGIATELSVETLLGIGAHEAYKDFTIFTS